MIIPTIKSATAHAGSTVTTIPDEVLLLLLAPLNRLLTLLPQATTTSYYCCYWATTANAISATERTFNAAHSYYRASPRH